MIQMETMLAVADNTGARSAKMIGVLGKRSRTACIGDVITALNKTPVRSIDRIVVGKGRRGPVAEALQKEFFGIVDGTKPDRFG